MQEEIEVSRINQTFQQLHESGELPLDDLARLLGGITRSAAYGHLGGVDPRWSQIFAVFHGSKSSPVQMALLIALTGGTGWGHIPPSTSLDADGNGKVELHDALRQSLGSLNDFAVLLRALQGEIADDKPLQGDDVDQLCKLATLVIGGVAMAQQIIQHVHQNQPQRRQAKPVAVHAKERA